MHQGTWQDSFSRHSSLQMNIEYIHVSPRMSLCTIQIQGDGAGLQEQRLYREVSRLTHPQSSPSFPLRPALAASPQHMRSALTISTAALTSWIESSKVKLSQWSAVNPVPPYPTVTSTYFGLMAAHPDGLVHLFNPFHPDGHHNACSRTWTHKSFCW